MKLISIMLMALMLVSVASAANFDFTIDYAHKDLYVVYFIVNATNNGPEQINLSMTSFVIQESGVSGPSNWFTSKDGIDPWNVLTIAPGESGTFEGASYDIGFHYMDNMTVYVKMKDQATEEEVEHTRQWFITDNPGVPVTPVAPTIISPMNEAWSQSVHISWDMPEAYYDQFQIQYTDDGVVWQDLATTTDMFYDWDFTDEEPGQYAIRVRAQKDGVWGPYQMSGVEPEKDYSDVLVLWVDNDAGSEEVADYYISEMNIPAENKCHISVNQGWGLDRIKRDTIQNETLDCIRALNHTINYVVYTRGMSIGYGDGFSGNPNKLSVDATTMYFDVPDMYDDMYDTFSDGRPSYETNYDWYYPATEGEFHTIADFTKYDTENQEAEDAYVRGGDYKVDKYSFEDSFVVKLSGDDSVWARKAILKFYEPEIADITYDGVNSAKLILHSKWTSTPTTIKLYATHEMWREKAIQWSTFPTYVEDDLLGEYTITQEDEEIVFDITDYINSVYMSTEEPLAFIITNDENKYANLWSSDAPYQSMQPKLVFNRGQKLLLYGRLDGWTVEEAKKLVDKSKDSWGKSGIVVVDQAHTDNDPLYAYYSYGGYETSLNETRRLAEERGYDVVMNDVQGGEQNIYLRRNPAVAFWGSWGSNDGSVLAPAWTFNSWAPGAIIETAVSTSAAQVTGRPGSYGQSRIVDTMWEGASGGRGSVAEPYISGIGRPHIIFDAYTRGYTMAEAYSMGAAKVLWEDLILGDPKMSPYTWSPFTLEAS